ncbi:MAG TPA: PadR family transcriptional regulator [Anaerolineaceae bacterium]|nr:PadR family transcriptional regulator [Anaerolineaceae bacterium]
MSLEHAILGLLDYEPMTGYDLKKMIDVSVAHFWPAVQSQIYKTLGRMETDGWVTVETIPQEPRPPRKVYAITEAGRLELFNWLQTPQPASEIRLAWLIQIFFAGRLSDEKIIALLEHQLQIYRQRLQGFSAIPPETHDQMEEGSPRDRFFWLLTVDYGVANAIFQVRWLETVIISLRKGEYHLPTLES